MESHLERAAQDAARLHGEYPCEAYLFALDALANCNNGAIPEPDLPRVGAAVYCWTAAELAIQNFGPLATEVLEFWGIHTKEDLHQLIMHLVEIRLFHKKYQAGMPGIDHVPPLSAMLDRAYRSYVSNRENR